MQRDILLLNRHFAGINPLFCGEQRCEVGHAFGPASREHYLVHYVMSGQGVFVRNGEKRSVGKGQMFVIRPGEMTYYQADSERPWHYCWVGFESSFYLEGILGQEVIEAGHCEDIFLAIKDCEQLCSSKELFVCGKIYELLSRLGDFATRSPAEEYVAKAKNYIESHYVDPITVDMLAQHLNLNRSYFSTTFKKHTGRSPQQYIVEFRLQKAAQLMAAQGYTVGEAALSAGYGDVCNFSRMFRRKFGMSPTDYVREIHSKETG